MELKYVKVSKEVVKMCLKNTVKKEALKKLLVILKKNLSKRVLSKIPLIGVVLGVGFKLVKIWW